MACKRCNDYTEEDIGFITALIAALPTIVSVGKKIGSLISGGRRSNRRIRAGVDTAARSQAAQSAGKANLNSLVSWQGNQVTVGWLRNSLKTQSNLIAKTNKVLKKVNKQLRRLVRKNKGLVKSVQTRTWVGAGSTVLALIIGVVTGRFTAKKAK